MKGMIFYLYTPSPGCLKRRFEHFILSVQH